MFYIGKNVPILQLVNKHNLSNENKVFINHCEFFHGVIRYYVLP